MKRAPLTIKTLAVNNLKRKPFRTTCLIIVVFILAFTIFGGSVLTASLKNGMNSVEQRLGADIMVVPDGNEADAEGILLQGKQSYFYFDRSVAEQVAKIEGVAQVTTQFYLTSVGSDHCSFPVQMIGIDPATDFVIQPWIAKSYGGELADGQVIIGSEITPFVDNTVKFFNQTYPVAAKLEKTATGLDTSVFMNMNTIKSILASASDLGYNFLSDQEPDSAISSVLVKVDKGYDVIKVVRNIRDDTRTVDVDVIVSKNMIFSISNSLGSFVTFIYILSSALWVLAVIVLLVVYSVTINERKKEFAVLRTLGAKRNKLIGIVLLESLFTSIIGALGGVLAAAAIVFPYSTYIGDKLQLPYLQPSVHVILGVLAFSLLLAFAVGPLASIYSAVRISKAETYLTMREGE